MRCNIRPWANFRNQELLACWYSKAAKERAKGSHPSTSSFAAKADVRIVRGQVRPLTFWFIMFTIFMPVLLQVKAVDPWLINGARWSRCMWRSGNDGRTIGGGVVGGAEHGWVGEESFLVWWSIQHRIFVQIILQFLCRDLISWWSSPHGKTTVFFNCASCRQNPCSINCNRPPSPCSIYHYNTESKPSQTQLYTPTCPRNIQKPFHQPLFSNQMLPWSTSGFIGIYSSCGLISTELRFRDPVKQETLPPSISMGNRAWTDLDDHGGVQAGLSISSFLEVYWPTSSSNSWELPCTLDVLEEHSF